MVRRTVGSRSRGNRTGNRKGTKGNREEPVLLTVAEAAHLVGVTPKAIRKRASKGGFSPFEATRRGRSMAAVSLEELASFYPEARTRFLAAGGTQGEPKGTQTEPEGTRGKELQEELEQARHQAEESRRQAEELRVELQQARHQAHLEELRAARSVGALEGQVEARKALERSLKAAEESFAESMTDGQQKLARLALELGEARAEARQLRQQIEAPRRGFFQRLLWGKRN